MRGNDIPGWLVKSSNICNAVSLTGGLKLMMSRKVVTPAMALSRKLAFIGLLAIHDLRVNILGYTSNALQNIWRQFRQIEQKFNESVVIIADTFRCCGQHFGKPCVVRRLQNTVRSARLVAKSREHTVTPTFPSAILELNHSSFSHTDANFILLKSIHKSAYVNGGTMCRAFTDS
jgi:hypothetical protein